MLDDNLSDAAALLLSRRPALLALARSIATLSPGGRRIRIHGDFHLGQTLRTSGTGQGDSAGDFVVLDFEGEPARPLAERRRKQSPLKDVAGMIRSFSYAAYSALNRFRAGRMEVSSHDTLESWAQAWQNAAAGEFLFAYRRAIAANHALLPAAPTAQGLLDAWLLEKALYELLYELNNRPEWLRIPIAGILML